MSKTDRPVPPGLLEREELKRRVSVGVLVTATRGALVAVLGFGGTVVAARLLSPGDFGAVAIGLSVVALVGLLSDGGLGAALIRRAEPPRLEELRSLTGLQLLVATGSAGAIAAAASQFGHVGSVAAVMVLAAPLTAFQFPGRIMLERSLSYRPLALVEVLSALAFHGWAVVALLAGYGVWGLATAIFARYLAGLLVMARVSPVGIVAPRFGWRRSRPLLLFGLKFQATSATLLVRDQGLNISVAAIATVATLGLWALAKRLLEIPYLLLASLWRVSYPAMSQLVVAKRDAAPVMERAAAMAVIATGVVLTALVGSAPGLVPGVFGEQWRDAALVLPGACLGVAIAGSVSVATQGYLYAVGDASAVLRAVVFQAAVLFTVTLPLLPVIGVLAVGVGLLASSLTEAVVLTRAARRRTDVRLARPLLVPVAAAIVCGLAGWVLASEAGADLAAGVAGGILSAGSFVGALLVFRRRLLIDTIRFALSPLRRGAPAGSTQSLWVEPAARS